MPTEADFRAILIDRTREARRHFDLTQARARRDASGAQTVIEHPGWAMFHGKLLEVREARQHELRALEVRLAHENMAQFTRECELLTIRRLTGVIEGLTIALDLIPEAVKQGQEAGTGDLA